MELHDFLNFFVSWAAAATAWLAVFINSRSAKTERAMIVIVEAAPAAHGLELQIRNVGGSGASDLDASLDGGHIGYFGGLASGDVWTLEIPTPASAEVSVSLACRDAFGKRRPEDYRLTLVGSDWRLSR